MTQTLTLGLDLAVGSYLQYSSDRFRDYLSSVRQLPRLTREEELELAERYREGDRFAGDRLVEAHLHAVVAMAHRYRGYRIPISDLVGEGSLGLLEAVKRFEPERGLRFLTYARHWIRAYILAFVLRQWSIVDLGTSAKQSKMFFRLQAEHSRLVTQLGGDDGSIPSRLAKDFGTSESKIESTLARLRGRDASLDAPLTVDGATSFVEMLRGDEESPVEHALASEREEKVQEAVAKLWSGLGDREKRIVRERLMPEDDGKSLAQLGREMGVTRERVRQIEVGIKRAIKRELEALYGDARSPYEYQPAYV